MESPPNVIETMNDELVTKAVDLEAPKVEPKLEIKKNSKKDIINRIFDVCEKFNIEISETEQQLTRKTRKNLLEILAGYVERSVENKIKSEQNGIPPECQNSDFVAQLPMLKLAHGFLCSLVEKGFNSGASYLEYSYELRNYAKTCNDSHLIDQCLIDIANDFGPELIEMISNAYYRLLFIHATSIMSCVKYIDKDIMTSPRFNMSVEPLNHVLETSRSS